jgi:2,3-bisphosphoglycerate-independent phosphoglycerate mutase
VLEAMGIDLELEERDMAARGNFCTIDEKGIITDRRAGRITTEKCANLCRALEAIVVKEVDIKLYPVREHRFVVIFRGANLQTGLTDSDPSITDVKPLKVSAEKPSARRTANMINDFIAGAKKILKDRHPANMILLRGFSKKPQMPTMQEIYHLTPLAIAVYPMYRGLARLVGMAIAPMAKTLEDEFELLRSFYNDYDFFFFHVKGTDTAGEDGDFARKVKVLEQIDASLPALTDLKPDVLVVTGDHSTPAVLKGHSWHPVPLLLCSKYCRTDSVREFSEKAFLAGGLGRIRAKDIMPLAMANALKLTKFGA